MIKNPTHSKTRLPIRVQYRLSRDLHPYVAGNFTGSGWDYFGDMVPQGNWVYREGQTTPIHVFSSGDDAELFSTSPVELFASAGGSKHTLVFINARE